MYWTPAHNPAQSRARPSRAGVRVRRCVRAKVTTDAFGQALGDSLAQSDWGGGQQEDALMQASQENFRVGEIGAQNTDPYYGQGATAMGGANGLHLGGSGLGVSFSGSALQDWNNGVDGGIALYAQRDSEIDAQARALAQQRAVQPVTAAWTGGAGGGRGFVNPDWTNPFSQSASTQTTTASAAGPTDHVGNWLRSLNLPEIPGVGWLSQSQAVSSAQHWQERLDATGNPIYAVAQGVASLWADHSQEVGTVLGSIRGVQGVPINGATRTSPLGFASDEQFFTAAQELQGALRQSGITDATVGVRGSSVTGYSFTKGTPFRPDSDIDFFIESEQLTTGYTTSGRIPGFVHPGKILPDYPLLRDWSTNWTNTLGRDVTPGAFVPETLPSQPTILVRPVAPGPTTPIPGR